MNEEQKLTQELAQRAGLLDAMEVAAPDLLQIRQMVQRQQAAAHRTQRRQLVLFVLVAGLVVFGVLYCLGNLRGVFFALQAAALAGAILTLAVVFLRTARTKAGER